MGNSNQVKQKLNRNEKLTLVCLNLFTSMIIADITFVTSLENVAYSD